MKKMIETLNDDILHDTMKSTFCIVSLILSLFTSMMCFAFAIIAFADNPRTPFETFMYEHAWIPVTASIFCVIGWAFYVSYSIHREDWADEGANSLAYTMWYAWHICTYAWIIMWPVYLVGLLIKLLVIDSTIWLVRTVTKPAERKLTLSERYDMLLRK